jgi:hypothetical protein
MDASGSAPNGRYGIAGASNPEASASAVSETYDAADPLRPSGHLPPNGEDRCGNPLDGSGVRPQQALSHFQLDSSSLLRRAWSRPPTYGAFHVSDTAKDEVLRGARRLRAPWTPFGSGASQLTSNAPQQRFCPVAWFSLAVPQNRPCLGNLRCIWHPQNCNPC